MNYKIDRNTSLNFPIHLLKFHLDDRTNETTSCLGDKVTEGMHINIYWHIHNIIRRMGVQIKDSMEYEI